MTIPLSADKLIPFTPMSILKDHPEVKFYLRPPTWEDRDDIGNKLYRMGARQVPVEQIRAKMIMELYVLRESLHPATDEGRAKAEEIADEEAAFLEGVWQRAAIDQETYAQWEMQEMQRLIDIGKGVDAAKLPQAPRPVSIVSVRERARATMLTTEIIDASKKVKDALIDQQGYDNRRKQITIRLHLAGWVGLKAQASYERDPYGENILTKQSIEDLRTEIYPMSAVAWGELSDEVEMLFDLPIEEVGNSDSLLENISEQLGSTTTNAASESSDGPSTKPEKVSSKSNTGPTPESE